MQAPQRTLLERILLAAIFIYRNSLSHMMLHSCRFVPTCSAYAEEAIRRFGVASGVARTICRLARCHPLSRPGFDPVTAE